MRVGLETPTHFGIARTRTLWGIHARIGAFGVRGSLFFKPVFFEDKLTYGRGGRTCGRWGASSQRKSCFLIFVVCTTRPRIPTSSSAHQAPKKGDLFPF